MRKISNIERRSVVALEATLASLCAGARKIVPGNEIGTAVLEFETADERDWVIGQLVEFFGHAYALNKTRDFPGAASYVAIVRLLPLADCGAASTC